MYTTIRHKYAIHYSKCTIEIFVNKFDFLFNFFNLYKF